MAHGGGDHFIPALRDREILIAMTYDLAKGEELTRHGGYITFSLIFTENSRFFHVHNPFPADGIYEDPVTGEAAALAGYLKDISWPPGGSVEISQDEDMGVPSRLLVSISPEVGSSIQVAGTVRRLR